MSIVESGRIEGLAAGLSTVQHEFFRVGPAGKIAMWDPAESQVLILDPARQDVAHFGRRGQGPGEFGQYVVGGWVADTVWTYDLSQRRFTFIAPTNRLLRSVLFTDGVRPRAGMTFGAFMPAALLADGTILGVLPVTSRSSIQSGREASVRRYAVVERSGEVVRLLAELPDDPNAHAIVTRAAGGGEVSFKGTRVPHATTPLRAAHASAPDGSQFAVLSAKITSATGGTISLDAFRPNGDTIFARTFPFVGAPISGDDADRASARIRDPMLRERVRGKVPEFYPPVDVLVLGNDGSVWLQLRSTRDGNPCILLDSRGRPVVTAVLPSGSELMQATRETLWTVSRDNDGIPSVVRYRVEGGQGR